MSESPDLAVIEHSAEGTLVTGTSRDNRKLVEQLKHHGFRWSRNLEAWYLPRTWAESTRERRIASLQAAAPGMFEVQRSDTPRRPAAEREADRQERAATRAVRLDRRAQVADRRVEEADQSVRRIQDGIPLGQPVLMGHHSQRRHERDLERIDKGMRRALEAERIARAARAGADRARAVASGAESSITIGNRIDRTEAELRRTRSALETAAGTYHDRLVKRVDELLDQLDHDRAKLAAAGGVPYSRENVRPDDFVRIRGCWYPVTRSNLKTVAVPSAMVSADSKSTNTTPWREVTDHLPRAQATPARVHQLIEATSPAFPGLRERLERAGANL